MLLAAAPALTRIYTPDQFGIFSLFVAVTASILPAASLRYEMAIPIAERGETARSLIHLCAVILTITTLLTAVLLYAASNLFSSLENFHNSWLIFAYAGAMVTMGVQQILSYWLIREKNFKRVSLSRCTQSMATLLSQILLGINWRSPLALISGFLIGQTSGVIVASTGLLATWRRVSGTEALCAARQYKEFPTYSAPGAVLFALSSYCGLFIVSFMFGPAAAGFFGLSLRVVLLPIGVIAQAVGQVFYSRAAEAHREGRLGSLVLKMYSRLLAVSLVLAMPMIVAGPGLIAAIFGEPWRESGYFVRYLAPWALLEFGLGPLSRVPFVLGAQRQDLRFQAIALAVRSLFAAGGAMLGGPRTAVLCLGIGSALVSFWYTLWILRTLGLIRSTVKEFLTSAVAAGACALPLVVVQLWLPAYLPTLIGAAVFCMALGGIQYWFRFHLPPSLKPNLSN